MTCLVCLHGFTGAPDAWDAVLDQLPPEIDTVCPAIVGHDPDIPLTGDFEHEVGRLARTLPRAGAPYHLAGYSLGGRLALGLLVRHRELFASATLIGVHPGLGTRSRRRARVAADDELADLLEQGGVARFVDRWQSLPLFASQCDLPMDVVEAQRRQRLRHRPEGLAHALRSLSLGRMPDWRPALSGLDLPIRLMAGERDIRFRRLAEDMAQALPAASVEAVAGAGHNLILEAPAAVARAITHAPEER